MLPVHAIDEPVQVLDQARNLALLELALEAVQPRRREVLHDDPVLPVRGVRSVGGGEQGQRRVVPPALEQLQLATTDHGSPPVRTARAARPTWDGVAEACPSATYLGSTWATDWRGRSPAARCRPGSGTTPSAPSGAPPGRWRPPPRPGVSSPSSGTARPSNGRW